MFHGYMLYYKIHSRAIQWSSSAAITPLVTAALFFILFVYVELRISPEPVLAPFLLEQKVPVLVGCNNFLVSLANFAIQYFFPLWFETVALTSASIAGMKILLNQRTRRLTSGRPAHNAQ